MTVEELREALAAYNRESQPPALAYPDVPGIDPDSTKLSPEVRDAAAELFTKHVLGKQAGDLTDSERQFLRSGIAAWSRENER